MRWTLHVAEDIPSFGGQQSNPSSLENARDTLVLDSPPHLCYASRVQCHIPLVGAIGAIFRMHTLRGARQFSRGMGGLATFRALSLRATTRIILMLTRGIRCNVATYLTVLPFRHENIDFSMNGWVESMLNALNKITSDINQCGFAKSY